jgi:hypothetical protein
MGSAAVSRWSVHEYVTATLDHAAPWPTVGTPEWCALPDDDTAKLAAIYDAAQHWALRVETCQAALAEASQAISVAPQELWGTTWAAIGQNIRDRNEFHTQRPWMKRVSA